MGEYARRDLDGTWVHCNTMEGIWSSLRNFLDHFKGISQRFLHLRVARYEFLHNHGHLPWAQAFEAALRCIFSTTGDYLRPDGPLASPDAANALLPMSEGLLLLSPVALRAPCEGASMNISCGCIWTPPVRSIPKSVSNQTVHQTKR